MSTSAPDQLALLLGRVILRAWNDPEFKQELLEAPRTALGRFGLVLPPDIDLVVVEDQEGVATFVIPPPPGAE
ncbi:MAG: NHLP leader peptide family natural product precursor [Armatimonadetes bacterium]|nr:NHLP leader peptide family natural product precursor [Armatimonadota bacterium]